MRALTLNECIELDAKDPLAGFRDEFYIPSGMIYLDGNSLGVMPRAAAKRVLEVTEREWGEGLIKSWNSAHWWELPVRLGDKLARLVGANPGEVVVTDSTGLNVYKALAAALSLVPERRVIVLEGSNFPTDNYIAQGLLSQLGDGYEIRYAEEAELVAALDSDIAVVCLTQVHYKSGRILDMKRLTAQAQAAGALVVWDLCHSAGAFEVDLNGCNADFAVGCTYKYLNGGPGSPAFIFVASRHQGRAQQPLTGWWSHADPFAFERDYRPSPGIRQMLSGTQPILSLAVAEVGLDIFLQVDMPELRRKSMLMTDLFIALVEERCAGYGFELASPRDANVRGSQVSLYHPDGYAIIQALIARDVVGDFRAPANMRFGFAPLYLGFADVWHAVDRLVQVMISGEWQLPQFSRRGAVT